MLRMPATMGGRPSRISWMGPAKRPDTRLLCDLCGLVLQSIQRPAVIGQQSANSRRQRSSRMALTQWISSRGQVAICGP